MLTDRRKVFVKLIVLGDSGVGKTALINQYVNRRFGSTYKATIGADFMSKEVVCDGKLATAQIWDTAGQERFKSLGLAFYRGSDCCILIFDLNSAKSFDNLDFWHNEFVHQQGFSDQKSVPIIVIGNKLDVGHRVVSQKRAQSWCQLHDNCAYFETSAKNDTQY